MRAVSTAPPAPRAPRRVIPIHAAASTPAEREVSLNSGAQVFEALDSDKYTVLRYDPQSDLPRLVADAARNSRGPFDRTPKKQA